MTYILNFHTNIITWKPCFHIEGIYYDGKDFRLQKHADNTIFACVEVFEELLVTEYSDITVFSTILEKTTTEADAVTTSNITISEKMISSNSSTSTNPSSNLSKHTSTNHSSNLSIRTKPSQKPKISIATQSTWYKRLGHSLKIAIQKLANVATGVQITNLEDAADELTTELCKPCHLSNVENQISRCLHIRSHTPKPTPEPTPGPAGPNVDTGLNVDTGPNVDTGLNIDINTQPAAIDDCTWNIAPRAHNISANFDEDNIIEGRRTRNHRAAHLVAVSNVKNNSL
ncbi:hypothetical protein BDDG_12745 [Blastomyces dermatitidis ATCC 18188]|uniref:GAG-pre-integrase domain-containing protein n=1 Tax=Ajellomyces dermatitidis (strain ATCC 18188 / CBS 674.68) TaxID=653446 RepID=A0A0J9HGU6_AJEDA|nr:hypothetical protein BDDG_12745 [Blastomyces dermatitidis ATCC 18188]